VLLICLIHGKSLTDLTDRQLREFNPTFEYLLKVNINQDSAQIKDERFNSGLF
jgi:hypothetical protein